MTHATCQMVHKAPQRKELLTQMITESTTYKPCGFNRTPEFVERRHGKWQPSLARLPGS